MKIHSHSITFNSQERGTEMEVAQELITKVYEPYLWCTFVRIALVSKVTIRSSPA